MLEAIELGTGGRLAAGVTPPRGMHGGAQEMLVVDGRVVVCSCQAAS